MADVSLVGNASGTDSYSISGRIHMCRSQAIKSGTANSIKVKMSGSANVRLALYSDNGGAPNALLCESSSTAVVTGVNTVSIPDTSIVLNNYYWTAIQGSVNSVYYVAGGTSKHKTYTYAAYPNPAGTGYIDESRLYWLDVWGAEPASGSPVPLLVGSEYHRRR
jgi:hypothetical protein